MAKHVCPYLGLINEPATAHVFPSEKNLCYKAVPPAGINNLYQRSHCLSTNHVTCQVFTSQTAVSLPAALSAYQPIKRQGVNWLSYAGLVTGLVIFVVGFIVFRNVTGGTRALPAFEPAEDVQAAPSVTATMTETVTITATRPVIATLTPLSSPFVPLSCAPPASWQPYTIRLGDTLASLSRSYGVAVDTLRSANCIPAGGDVRAGERIFVPGPTATLPPTRTPVPSATITQTPTSVRTFVFATATSTSVGPPPPAPTPQPTSTPLPTAVSPTLTPIPTTPVAPTLPPPPPATPNPTAGP